MLLPFSTPDERERKQTGRRLTVNRVCSLLYPFFFQGFELALLIHSDNRGSNYDDGTVHAVMPWATDVTTLQCKTPDFGR